ncbi:hypothetical protein [Micromonospora sp. NPDC048843]|uniref:hypothetical protein n=1 Tax=Micromonospora sp. NPDC048843 TaxID=3155389 RepID=UPI0033DC43C8
MRRSGISQRWTRMWRWLGGRLLHARFLETGLAADSGAHGVGRWVEEAREELGLA